MIRALAILLGLGLLAVACIWPGGPEPRWWKGNTHTHTLWSDGDSTPELVAAWYRARDYHFLVLSDHDVLSQGDSWRPIDPEAGAPPGSELREGADGLVEMRLRTLPELRDAFEYPGEFLFLQGEEISAEAEGKPVHVNGLNLAEVIEPIDLPTVLETLQANVQSVIEQGERLGRPVLPHVNHPNYQWALTAEQIASLRGESFFEVFNGHPAVMNDGDAEHSSTEELWDIALTLRLTELDLPLLYGLATDDAHTFAPGRQGAPPGRGWIHVRSTELEPSSLVEAMLRGDFYASTGVTLSDVVADGESLRVEIDEQGGETLTTTFYGTRRGPSAEVGEALLETSDNPAVYRFEGDELYVRATVVSSRSHPEPTLRVAAWVQPVIPGKR